MSVSQQNAPDEYHIRSEKVPALRKLGIEPWPAAQEVTATAQQVLDEFAKAEESKQYKVAGRVVIIRHHGKASFVVIQDATGRIQLYFQQDVLGDAAYEQFKHFIDIGDIIWVHGESFKTKMGQTTLKVESYSLLSKCLHPLPEKFHGLTDIETIYRQRYLDLITNQESRERFIKRSLIIRTMRRFLDDHNFLEVETPMLHPIPGGAAAKPFVTHHNALGDDFYLRIAPELYLKRLVVGGFERVYEINRNFRNEGISTRHNPEFTMLEMYTAYKSYDWAMDLIEQMIKECAQKVCGTTQITYHDIALDFEKPFARLTMQEAVCRYGNLKPEDINEKNIDTCLQQASVKLANKKASWGEKLYALFEKLVEHNLMQPTFITQFPIEVSPLAKQDDKDPRFAARFELFMAGIELANGFNELNDPFDQSARFKQQASAREGGDVEAHHYDAEYIKALEYALPPTAGVGIGIDRLTMFLTNASSIKDVILFPTLKRKD